MSKLAPALVKQAEVALLATGGTKVSSSSAPYNEALFKLCSSNPAHCVAVVEKAHKLREQLQKKLTASFPNLESFQERILTEAVKQSSAKLALDVPLAPEPGVATPWLSNQNSGFPSDWIAQQVVEAQTKALKQMTDDEKRLWFGAGSDLQDDETKPKLSQMLNNGAAAGFDPQPNDSRLHA